jgi:hypothetical protein
MGILPQSHDEAHLLTQLKTFAELVGLMIVLAIGAPFNDSRLNELRDAEQSMVWLEWMKAYFGRLLGPLFAIIVYNWAGHQLLLNVLRILTVLVTIAVFKLKKGSSLFAVELPCFDWLPLAGCMCGWLLLAAN